MVKMYKKRTDFSDIAIMLLRLAKPVLILPVRNLTKKPKSIITNLNYFKSGKSDGPPFTHFVQIGKFRIKLGSFFSEI